VSLVLTGFQLASTERTVTTKAVPAFCVVGVPVLPLVVPGAAVSPGSNNCSFTNTPGLTEIPGLVLAALLPSERSVAVKVLLPAVLSFTLKVWVPLLRAALAGSVALASLELMPMVSPAVLIRFQLASTALTVTVRGLSVFCAPGLPILPVVVPGAAVSPGTSNCSLVNASALTVTDGLVPGSG
jgi:hypothetical protein